MTVSRLIDRVAPLLEDLGFENSDVFVVVHDKNSLRHLEKSGLQEMRILLMKSQAARIVFRFTEHPEAPVTLEGLNRPGCARL